MGVIATFILGKIDLEGGLDRGNGAKNLWLFSFLLLWCLFLRGHVLFVATNSSWGHRREPPRQLEGTSGGERDEERRHDERGREGAEHREHDDGA